MKKLMLLTNIVFFIISLILFVFLIYIGITKEFSIIVCISIVVILCVGIHSVVKIFKED